MTLQDMAQIGGVIGVIASMVYVAIQIRNSGRATRAATYQQLSSAMANSWLNTAFNAEMVSLMLRGSNDFDALNRVEKTRMRFFMMAYARNFENAFFQHEIGILKNRDWLGISADIHVVFSMPGTRKIWQLVKNRSSTEFQAYIDAIVNAAEAKQAIDDAAKPTVKPSVSSRNESQKRPNLTRLQNTEL